MFVPQTALDYDYLLSAILSMSALHISTTALPSQSKGYQLAALEYQNLAITAFQAEHRSATSEAYHALFAFSIVNLILAVALPSRLDRDTGRTSIVDSLVTLFKLLRGTASIVTSARTFLQSGPFSNFVRRTAERESGNLEPYTQAAFRRLRLLRDEDYAVRSASADHSLDAVYMYESITKAIESLEYCFSIHSVDKLGASFRWLAMLEPAIVDGISNLDPLALLITMHWAILLDGLSGEKWWARSSGKALAAEITKILTPQKPEWLSAMSWAHREVGLPPLVGV